ncbi:MAG TPA: SET domain-containing protein [Gemmatimonadaceae bacterium]
MDAVEVRPSAIDGSGVFATRRIPARRKLGELAGELISHREARRRAKTLTRIAIVEFDSGMAIDASVGGNSFRYTNHSCAPNAYMRIIGQHVEFYSLRPIKAGEEITCRYGDTQHEGTVPCRCGRGKCREYL